MLFGYICWVDAVILLCSLPGAITLGMNIKQMKKVVKQTVNAIGREGDVLRITFRAFFIILIEYMIISMLYTYMIFPTFGM